MAYYCKAAEQGDRFAQNILPISVRSRGSDINAPHFSHQIPSRTGGSGILSIPLLLCQLRRNDPHAMDEIGEARI
jgi:hypothetical protein